MEEELGGLLFSRERNNTHLTELGRLIEPHLAEVVARAGQAKQTAARFLKLEDAHLAVGVMCTIRLIRHRGGQIVCYGLALTDSERHQRGDRSESRARRVGVLPEKQTGQDRRECCYCGSRSGCAITGQLMIAWVGRRPPT
jgi:hypothetical protein